VGPRMAGDMKWTGLTGFLRIYRIRGFAVKNLVNPVFNPVNPVHFLLLRFIRLTKLLF
jgi:hypothetical protein